IETDNQTKAEVVTFYGDSVFFETLGIDVLSGNPRQDLNNLPSVSLSDKMATQLFGSPENAVGHSITLNQKYDKDYTVAGIFKALPENNTMCPQAVLSIAGFAQYFGWRGGDSWWGFLRKTKDCNLSLDDINARIAKIVEKNAPAVNGISIEIQARPISQSIYNDSNIRSMMYILLSLAITILIIAVFNYVLISIASLARRAKAVGVHKCCGAGTGSILSMFVTETIIIIFAALALAALLLFTFRDFIESTLQTPVSGLFDPSRLWVTAAVIVLTIIVGGFIPGIMLSRIEVSTIFRRFTKTRRSWKRILLFIQITGATIILTMSTVVLSQLNFALNLDPGYRIQGLAIVPSDYDTKDAFASDIRSLHYVI
ncbi:MAG: ABC transporter permease, partial [Muribaculaceae bacterium]|nr:ABC transporter permease [Muribaculaceae bacterium]